MLPTSAAAVNQVLFRESRSCPDHRGGSPCCAHKTLAAGYGILSPSRSRPPRPAPPPPLPSNRPAHPAVRAPPATAAARGADRRPLTFEAALTAALSRSLEAQRASLAVEQAAADLAVLSYEERPAPEPFRHLGRPPAEGRGPDRRRRPQRRHLRRPGQRDALRFGRHAARIEQGAAVRDVKTLAKDEVADALRYKVARTYAGVLATERVVTIADDQVRVSSGKLDQQRANYRKGLRPESDVVSSEVDLGRARLDPRARAGRPRATRLALALLMGGPPTRSPAPRCRPGPPACTTRPRGRASSTAGARSARARRRPAASARNRRSPPTSRWSTRRNARPSAAPSPRSAPTPGARAATSTPARCSSAGTCRGTA